MIDSTSVAIQSILPARLEPTTPCTLTNGNNSNNTLTHNTHSTNTPHTTHTTTTTTRPHTRTTSDALHPFFVDLLNRTGKAAKHFRQLYTPTATICECGLFPIYSQQNPSTAPTTVLPAPFQHLCLACFKHLNDGYFDPTQVWPCMPRIPDYVPVFWNESMQATYNACYLGYYTTYMDDTQQAAPIHRYGAAFFWLKNQAMEYHKQKTAGTTADKTDKADKKRASEGASKEIEKGSDGVKDEAEMKTAAGGAASQM